MDQIFGAVGALEVAIFLFAEESAVHVRVHQREVHLILDQRVELAEVLDQPVGVAVV